MSAAGRVVRVLKAGAPRALIVAAAAALPACVFWDMSDWSDHAATTSGGGGSSPDAGRCFIDGGQTLFCDDFEPPPIAWSDASICDTCSLQVEALDAAPGHVLAVQSKSPSQQEGGGVFRFESIPGSFSVATVHFSIFVARSDPSSEAAVEELGIGTGATNLGRVRLWLKYDGSARLNTAVEAPGLSGLKAADVPAQIEVTTGAWHRVAMTIDASVSKPTVSLVIDGQQLVSSKTFQDGSYLSAPFDSITLTNGIRYLGYPSDGGGWEILLDDVWITSP
jgi:hypothetical protein